MSEKLLCIPVLTADAYVYPGSGATFDTATMKDASRQQQQEATGTGDHGPAANGTATAQVGLSGMTVESEGAAAIQFSSSLAVCSPIMHAPSLGYQCSAVQFCASRVAIPLNLHTRTEVYGQYAIKKLATDHSRVCACRAAVSYRRGSRW